MIYHSRVSEISIPKATLSEHVLASASRLGDKTAVVDATTGVCVSYAQLDDLSARAATGLVRAGVAPGDVVAVVSYNQPMYAVAIFAILRAGAVITPVNPALTAAEIGKQLAAAGAVAVIAAADLEDKVTEARRGTGTDLFFWLSGADPASSFEGLFNNEPLHGGSLSTSESIAVLPYSSGTTGVSKGVALSHRNIVANLEQLRVGWRLTDTDVLCAALPFFHIYGFTVILQSALLAGATVVTLPRFDLRTYLQTVQDYQVTRGHLAPPVALALTQAPEIEQFDLSSMRTAISGAAPLDEEVVVRAEARTGIVIRQGYGMTEASPGTHMVYDEDFDCTPPGSVGRLMPGTEARIVDPATGQDAPPGGRGELLIRGPQVMQGYLGNREATAATITDGWLHTGDVAVVEGENFFIVDRLKELIKYKGYQIAPAELEALLLSHPSVCDAAVIGIPHATGGEAPKAFVVPASEIDPDDLMAWVAERVAPYKKLRAIEYIEQVPKSAAGKILRRVLKDRVLARTTAGRVRDHDLTAHDH